MARPARPERSRSARSLRQLTRFYRSINPDRVFGTHRSYVTRPVCVANSWGADFFADVRPLATEAIVTKHRYSAFHNTDLETILRANGIRTVVLSGCATNVCVETSAREAFLRDYYVVIAEDGTAGY